MFLLLARLPSRTDWARKAHRGSALGSFLGSDLLSTRHARPLRPASDPWATGPSHRSSEPMSSAVSSRCLGHSRANRRHSLRPGLDPRSWDSTADPQSCRLILSDHQRTGGCDPRTAGVPSSRLPSRPHAAGIDFLVQVSSGFGMSARIMFKFATTVLVGG
jgi:hypothetical protein